MFEPGTEKSLIWKEEKKSKRKLYLYTVYNLKL